MGVLFVIFVIFLYFLPSFVAGHRGKANLLAIAALNFFLGWTVIGWVGALVWALTDDRPVMLPVSVHPVPPVVIPAQKRCPDCAEMVLAEARKCRFCGHQFEPPAATATS